MPAATHVTVKIPKDLVEEMDRLKGKHGFRSRGEIAKEAIRRLLQEYVIESPLEHFNLDENGVKILDREIDRVVDVYFKPEGIRCDYCEADECRHIKFALTVPAIQKVVIKRRNEGWKLPLL